LNEPRIWEQRKSIRGKKKWGRWISKVVQKSVEIVLRRKGTSLKVASIQKNLGFWEEFFFVVG
jgi:hypothetical protein